VGVFRHPPTTFPLQSVLTQAVQCIKLVINI